MINIERVVAITGEVGLGKTLSIQGDTSTGKTITLQGDIQAIIGIKEGYPEFIGPYIVTPKVSEQTLDTNDKLMKDDVTIREITKHIFDNEKGLTVQIGEI